MNLADSLNLGCVCSTLQPDLLRQALDVGAGLPGTALELAASRPHLFSATPVYVSAADYARMESSVAALDRVVFPPIPKTATRPAAIAPAGQTHFVFGCSYDLH